MSAKPILLGIIWLLGRYCVAQPVGYVTSFPDSALWSLMAQWDSVPKGKIVEGLVLDRKGRPAEGLLVCDMHSPATAITDRKGYARMWVSDTDSLSFICAKVNSFYNSINSYSNNYRFFNIRCDSTRIVYLSCPTDDTAKVPALTYIRIAKRFFARYVPQSASSYWHLTLSNESRQAKGLITESYRQRDTVFDAAFAVYQGWGDSLLWAHYVIPTLQIAVEAEIQNSVSLLKKTAIPSSLKASWMGHYFCCGEDYGNKVFVENNAPSQHALSKITEYYCISSSYSLDRHDLIHRYQPQYDSAHQQWFIRTDSLTWYYHKVGAYNWPCHFSMTSRRTALNADSTPGCTDTLRATLSLLHLSPGQPAPVVRRQMVDLFHLPTTFPPVDEAFRRHYARKP